MSRIRCEELIEGLFRFEDSCNVYLLRRGDRGLAIDFGGGAWFARLGGLKPP